MSKIDINVKSSDSLFRLAKINHDSLDGSVYLTLVRENENTSGFSQVIDTSKFELSNTECIDDVSKIVRISCHTSGVIKYHNLSTDRIYNEPLFDISEPFFLLEYLVKDIDSLLQCSESDNSVTLPEKESEQFYSFYFYISNDPLPDSITLSFYDGLFCICMKIGVVEGIEDSRDMPFYYLTPSSGKLPTTLNETACVLFHQKLNDTSGIIIYEPNRTGIYTMVFHETRRSVPDPKKLIKFACENHVAEFTSIKPYYAKFYVRDVHTGEKIIKRDNLIEGIVFDNRL